MSIQATTIKEKYHPPAFDTQFINWAGDKPKYFMELLANASWYASQFFPKQEFFGDFSSGLVSAKGFFGIPGAVKGTYDLVQDWMVGKDKSIHDWMGGVGYAVSDAIDGLKAVVWSGAAVVDKGTMNILGKIKNVGALLGLTNSVHKDTVTLSKLSKIDPDNITSKVKDKAEAKQIKAEWVNSETNRVWWNRERNIMGVALCTLGLVASAVAISPWIFAAFVTVGVTGKMMTHMNKQEAGFWQTRFAEQVVPDAKAPAAVAEA